MLNDGRREGGREEDIMTVFCLKALLPVDTFVHVGTVEKSIGYF